MGMRSFCLHSFIGCKHRQGVFLTGPIQRQPQMADGERNASEQGVAAGGLEAL